MIKKEEILFELVSERPLLYQKANKNYKDSRAVKPNNWKEIVLVMKEKLFLNKSSSSKSHASSFVAN